MAAGEPCKRRCPMIEIFKNGGPVMYPLLFYSVLSLTVIIERTIFWSMVDLRANRQLVHQVMERCRVGNWESVGDIASGSKFYVIRIEFKLAPNGEVEGLTLFQYGREIFAKKK